MKKLVLALAGLGFLVTSCAPSAKQLKEVIEKNPDVVFVAIEKDPQKFIEVVNKAARDAQSKERDREAAEEQKKRDEEFANPLKPVVEDGRATEGPKDAPITIVEYSDFQCPYCARGYQNLREVLKEYNGKVRFVFKHLPLTDIHPRAMPAAKYFEAIARQSSEKAYQWHNMVFENQSQLTAKGEDYMKEAAKKVGADMKKVEKDLKDESLMKRIQDDSAEAQKFGFTGTPGFVINGVSLRGAYPPAEFKKIIDRHLGGKK